MHVALRRTLMLYSGVAIAVVVITQLRHVAFAADIVPLLVGALLLGTGLKFAEERGLAHHGLAFEGLLDDVPEASQQRGAAVWARRLRIALKELAVACAVMAVVFPPFAWGFVLLFQPAGSWTWHPPADLPSRALGELLVIALPEEAFFRGWLQTELSDRWPPKRKALGLSLPVRALFLQALLFALMHWLVEPHPARLAVFFPGLLFGVLRAWRGGIGAAVVLHATSNLYSEILASGFGR